MSHTSQASRYSPPPRCPYGQDDFGNQIRGEFHRMPSGGWLTYHPNGCFTDGAMLVMANEEAAQCVAVYVVQGLAS